MIKLSFLTIILILFPWYLIHASGGSDMLDNKIKKLDWNGVEVVWLQDDRFPTYDVIFYFADGSLSDARNHKGSTNTMFSLLEAGTRRYGQREISDHLEYFGVSYGGRVTHEYSTYKVSGLVKDIIPTMKMICHLFQDAVFPRSEVKKEKRRIKNSLRSLISSHSSLVERAFRELSMQGGPFYYPVTGKLTDIKHINNKILKSKLNYFNQKVAKKVFITGPANTLQIEKIVKNECKFSNTDQHYTRRVNYPLIKFSKGPKIFFIPVKGANQVQVRIGRFLNRGEYEDMELLDLAATFLGGGGLTSKLMQELRVKRGLTYSASAFAAGQRDYGRVGITVYTKNETLSELLNVTLNVIKDLGSGNYTNSELAKTKRQLIGGHPFKFESNSDFLNTILYMEHIGKPYNEIYLFDDRVTKISKEKLSNKFSSLFGSKYQTIVVLGNKKVINQLKPFGKVRIVPYKRFL
ncbi:MAG: insulinase family protein [Bacteriovoracaceae bacterium]|nr:insulinase family protein [Bacteriovoracaceae bacterium]